MNLHEHSRTAPFCNSDLRHRNVFIQEVERQFHVVECQLPERRSRTFWLNLITDTDVNAGSWKLADVIRLFCIHRRPSSSWRIGAVSRQSTSTTSLCLDASPPSRHLQLALPLLAPESGFSAGKTGDILDWSGPLWL